MMKKSYRWRAFEEARELLESKDGPHHSDLGMNNCVESLSPASTYQALNVFDSFIGASL
jgi:hypothetical protein